MKIIFYGDSITDMGRSKEYDGRAFGYGVGYVNFIAGDLLYKEPKRYVILDRGISGNRIVDLYARVKADVWNEEPDVLSILIGINDVWHEVSYKNGVDIRRWEKMYRMLLEDTKERFPNLKIMICEPFLLDNAERKDDYDRLVAVKDYAATAKKLAAEYGATFVPLQAAFDEAAKNGDGAKYLFDGVHPDAAGARLIANEWLKAFETLR